MPTAFVPQSWIASATASAIATFTCRAMAAGVQGGAIEEALPLSDAEKNRIWVLLVCDRDNALTEVDWIIYTASCGPTSRSVTRSTKASCVGIRN
jgi:hypothetical protein